MKKFLILLCIFLFSTLLIYSQYKGLKENEVLVRGKLEKFSRISITVNGKEYYLPSDVLIKERIEGKNDTIVVKEREDKLKPGIFEAVEEVSIVLRDGQVSEVIIELVRK